MSTYLQLTDATADEFDPGIGYPNVVVNYSTRVDDPTALATIKARAVASGVLLTATASPLFALWPGAVNTDNPTPYAVLYQKIQDLISSGGGGGGGDGSALGTNYDNSTSGLAGSNVQAAIDELDAETDALAAAIAANSAALANKANLTDVPFTANLTGTVTTIPAPSAGGVVSDLTLAAALGKFAFPTGFAGSITYQVRVRQGTAGNQDYEIENATYGGDGVKPAIPTAAHAFLDIVAWTLDGGSSWFVDKVNTTSGGGGSVRVEDEGGSPLPARSNLNFVGAITATDDSVNDRTNITIPYDKRWHPSDNMLKGANMDPAIAAGLGNTILAVSTTYVWRMKGRIADVMTGVAFDLAVATTGTLTGPFQFALYAADGNTVLAQTADCTSAMGAASGPTLIPFVTPYTVPADTMVYVALRTGTVSGGNMPKLSGSGSLGLINLGLNVGVATNPNSTSAPRFATSTATWSGTTPPAALGNITTANAIGVMMGLY